MAPNHNQTAPTPKPVSSSSATGVVLVLLALCCLAAVAFAASPVDAGTPDTALTGEHSGSRMDLFLPADMEVTPISATLGPVNSRYARPTRSVSAEITEENILNPFAQPNTDLGQAYGSGDVNQDGKVGQSDLDSMTSGVQNDYADINGNGIPSDTTDQRMLEEFLEGSRSHLPGHWNNPNHSKLEKIAWVQNMLAIDQTDDNDWVNGSIEDRWISGNFSNQLYMNFFGYSGNDIPEKYDTTNIGRFNIPVYAVSWYNPDTGIGHGFNGFLLGDTSNSETLNPLDIGDYWFVEPSDDNIAPGDSVASRAKNLRIVINGATYFKEEDDMPYPIPLVEFEIDSSGNPSITYQNQDLITERPENTPHITPDTLTDSVELPRGMQSPLEYMLQNYPNPVNASTTIVFSLPARDDVSMTVYDIRGRAVRTLFEGRSRSSGWHRVAFDAGDLPSGTYFCRLTGTRFSRTTRLVIVK